MFRFATLVCFVFGITAVPTTAAVITWTAVGGGSWHTASNWDLNRVPAAGDDVVIPDMSPDINVTFSTGSTSINSLTNAESFTLSGGTLDIAAASALNGAFALSGGTLSGSGDVTVTGAMSWTNNPTMSGSGKTIIASTGSLNISDSGQKFLARVLENHSANVTWSDGDIAFGGGTLNNASDGTINVTGAASRGFTNSGGTNAVNNAGTFNKSGTATLIAQFNIPFSNTGTVNLDAGTLTLSGGGTNSTQIDADAGTTLTFSTSYTHGGASSLTGLGTLTFSGGTHTITGTLDANRIININATVNFNAPYTFPGTVNLSGGALGGSGDATITGTLNWTNNPTMSGSGKTIIASTGSLNISDSGQKFLARVLENHSANVTWSDGDIAFGGGTLNNASDGTINVTGAASRGFTNSGGTNAVNNAGTFNKSGTATLTAQFNIPFSNTGTVNLDAGTLTLSGGGTNSTQIDADAGTTLTFSTSYTHGGASSLTGLGTLTFSGGTHTITGTLDTNRIINIGAGSTIGTVNFNAPYTFSGTVNLTGALGGSGDATITGTLNWTAIQFGPYGQMLGAGKTIITAGAILNITGFNHVLGRVLENHSANVTWSDGDIVFVGGTLNNAADGTINVTGAAGRGFANGGGSNAVNNAGIFNKGGGAMLSAETNVPFNNTGIVNLDAGGLTLAGGGTNSTQIDADAGTTLTFSTSYTHGGASSLTGQGTLTFSGGTHTITGTLHTNRIINIGAGSTVNFNAPYTFAGTVNLTSAMGGSGDATITGTLNWTAIEFGSYGQMLGAGKTTITAAAILNITGVNHVLGRVLENHSANVTWSGGDIVFAGGTWNNAFDGTINITGAANRVCDNGGGTNAVNNAGTFNKSGAATVTAQSGVPFNNSGTVNILSGTLTANNTYVQTAGTTILSGGNLIKTGTALVLQGGQLKGNGTLTGDVNNSGGTVAPGLSPGGLNISGNYTQQSGGTLAIEIGGPIPDLEFDVLSVGGTATLNGTLLATLTFGFDPVCGNTFQFLTAGTVSGTFQTLSAPDAGLTIEAQYAATSATIRALGGDMNCDDLINGLDVQAFVTALINPAGYPTLHPTCDILNADFTLDNVTTTADIPAFVQHLLTGVCP